MWMVEGAYSSREGFEFPMGHHGLMSVRGGSSMKRLRVVAACVSVLWLIGTSPAAQAAKVFVTEYASQATHTAFQVQYASQANCKVFKVKYASQAAPGKWFYVQYASQADLKIHWVQYASQAKLKVYFVQYASQADCLL
jgi:hypothetical protein